MSFSTYDKYLKARRRALMKQQEPQEQQEQQEDIIEVTYKPVGNVPRSNNKYKVNLLQDVIYLIDLDITRFLPEAAADLRSNFKMDLLPAGKWCMMNSVCKEGCPFMGPNLYVTPPGASTVYHEDGNGTVDSGHQVITGYNEVILFPRIDSSKKQKVLDIVTGNQHNLGGYKLKVEPHDDAIEKKPLWSTTEQFDNVKEYLCSLKLETGSESKKMTPTHVILGPGDYIHLNKGRIHAFRKVTAASAAAEKGFPGLVAGSATSNDICVSVAWDWMYRGFTPEAIINEVAVIRKTVEENRAQRVKTTYCTPTPTLAILDDTILSSSSRNLALMTNIVDRQNSRTVLATSGSSTSIDEERFWKSNWYQTSESTSSTTTEEFNTEHNLIVPLLVEKKHIEYLLQQYEYLETDVVDKKLKLFCRWPRMGDDAAMNFENLEQSDSNRTKQIVKPISEKLSSSKQSKQTKTPILIDVLNPEINAYDLDGFQCKSCLQGLSNVYMHCQGCEILLKKDYNVCIRCFRSGFHMISDDPRILDALGKSTAGRHHVGLGKGASVIQRGGTFDPDNGFATNSKPGRNCCSQRSCAICGNCYNHHCRCHAVFQSRFRFLNTQSLRDRVEDMSKIITEYQNNNQDYADKIQDYTDKVNEASEHDKERRLFDKHSCWRRLAREASSSLQSMFSSPHLVLDNTKWVVRLCRIKLLSGINIDKVAHLQVDHINWARGVLMRTKEEDADTGPADDEVVQRQISIRWLKWDDLETANIELYDSNDDLIDHEFLEWNKKSFKESPNDNSTTDTNSATNLKRNRTEKTEEVVTGTTKKRRN